MTAPRMFAPRVGMFAGYHFSENVTVQQAVALREAIEAMPALVPAPEQECDTELRAAWLELARKSNDAR